MINTLEWFPRWTRFGSHDLKLVSRYLQKTETFKGTVPGDRKIFLNGGRFERQQEYFSNDPRLDGEDAPRLLHPGGQPGPCSSTRCPTRSGWAAS